MAKRRLAILGGLCSLLVLTGCGEQDLSPVPLANPARKPGEPRAVLNGALDKLVHWPTQLQARYESRTVEPASGAAALSGRIEIQPQRLAGVLTAYSPDSDPLYLRYLPDRIYLTRSERRWLQIDPAAVAGMYRAPRGELARAITAVDPRDQLRLLLATADLRYARSIGLGSLTADCYAGTARPTRDADRGGPVLRARLLWQSQRLGVDTVRIEGCVGRDGWPRRFFWTTPVRGKGNFSETTRLFDFQSARLAVAPPAAGQLVPAGQTAGELDVLAGQARDSQR